MQILSSLKKIRKGFLEKYVFGFTDLDGIGPADNLTFSSFLHDITIVYPIYITNIARADNVFQTIGKYESLPDEIRSHLHIIVVDDASPVKFDFPKFNLNLQIFRINENIKWNSGGAKNLGVCAAGTERIITVDIDQWFPEETLHWCMTVEQMDFVYLFKLSIFDDEKTLRKLNHPHPNTFFMSKKTYFSLHGYDEDLCGYYGDDIFFRKYLMSRKDIKVFNSMQDNYLFEFKDAHSLKRKINCKFLLFRKQFNHSTDMLRFHWEFVLEYKYLT